VGGVNIYDIFVHSVMLGEERPFRFRQRLLSRHHSEGVEYLSGIPGFNTLTPMIEARQMQLLYQMWVLINLSKPNNPSPHSPRLWGVRRKGVLRNEGCIHCHTVEEAVLQSAVELLLLSFFAFFFPNVQQSGFWESLG